MWEVLNNSWKQLRDSKYSKVRSDVRLIEGLLPMILNSDLPLCINDVGFSVENSTNIKRSTHDFVKEYVEVHGREISPEKIQEERMEGKWLNFIHFPINEKQTLILADDLWRCNFYLPISKKLFYLTGISSKFLDSFFSPPIFFFKNSRFICDYLHNRLSQYVDYFDELDEVIIFSERVTERGALYLNSITMGQCKDEIAFKDEHTIMSSVEYHNHLCDENIEQHKIDLNWKSSNEPKTTR